MEPRTPESAALKKKRHSSFLIRIMAINVCCLLLVSVFNFSTFYSTSNSAFLENISHYNSRVSELAFRNIDEQLLQSMAKLPSLYFSDLPSNSALLRPQRENVSESPAAVRAFADKLREAFNACPTAAGLDVYYKNTGTICTGSGNLHFSADARERARFLPWLHTFEASGRNSLFLYSPDGVYPATERPDSEAGSAPVISYITKVFNPRWTGQEIVVAVHAPASGFSRYIDEQQGTLILSDESGGVIYASHGRFAFAQRVVEQAQGDASGALQLDGEELVLSQRENAQLGVRYYYAIPRSMFVRSYSAQFRALWLNYLVSVLFTLAVLLGYSYLSGRTYRRRVVSATQKAGVALAASDGSFDHSLDALTNHLTTLNSVVQQTKPIVSRNDCRSLILGRHSSGAYVRTLPGLPYAGVFCFVVHISPADAARADLDSALQALEAEHADCAVLLTTLALRELVLAVNTDAEAANAVRERMVRCLSDVFGQFYAADGQWFELSEGAFPLAFESAQNVCGYHFIFPEMSYLSWVEIGTVARKNTGSHLKIFALLEKDIRGENLLDLKQRLSDLTESFKFGGYSIDYCRSTLRDLVALLCNITQSLQFDMLVIYGYDLRDRCEQITDIDAFYRWSCEVCEVLMQNLRQRKKNIDPDLHSRLIALIDQNLEHDISLEMLAGSVHMRPDVLSRTFKHLTGQSYIDYIKEKKLLRAKALIAEGLSMQQIAQRLGYNSTQYFIRIFKESYGVTPYQYKKNGGANT